MARGGSRVRPSPALRRCPSGSARAGRTTLPCPAGQELATIEDSVVAARRAGRSFNGRTRGSGPRYRGSNPCLPAIRLAPRFALGSLMAARQTSGSPTSSRTRSPVGVRIPASQPLQIQLVQRFPRCHPRSACAVPGPTCSGGSTSLAAAPPTSVWSATTAVQAKGPLPGSPAAETQLRQIETRRPGIWRTRSSRDLAAVAPPPHRRHHAGR